MYMRDLDNIVYSLYTQPTPSSLFARVLEPESGPRMSVLVHEARRIRIQWDELPVEKQRGFITNYTIYLQTLDSSNTKLSGEHCVLLCVFVLYSKCNDMIN